MLLVEDSAVTREYLQALLAGDAELEVVGVGRDGVEAVELAERLRPGLVLMDVHMPRLDGVEATRQIMTRAPAPIVLMSASLAEGETTLGFEAIKAGALTLIAKPPGLDDPEAEAAARRLIETVKLMAEVRVVRRFPPREPAPKPEQSPLRVQSPIRIVAIGASTGGPAALAEILAALPLGLDAAILVVQHIAPGFAEGLVAWLQHQTPLPVRLAQAGESVRRGAVYVAPDGVQMGVDATGRIRLAREESTDGFQPSASHLFASVAQSYGGAAIGVLLTGMGRDGALGLLRLREAGGVTVAQDEQSSVIFGMPGEAVRAGAVQHLLAPREIADLIRALVGGG